MSGPTRGGPNEQAVSTVSTSTVSTSTDAVHAGTPHHRPHNTLAPGIAQTATYTFRDSADLERYMRGQDPDIDREEYGRYGNPTVRELETRVAALESADDALALPVAWPRSPPRCLR
jgi:cystathionine gamma-synthase